MKAPFITFVLFSVLMAGCAPSPNVSQHEADMKETLKWLTDTYGNPEKMRAAQEREKYRNHYSNSNSYRNSNTYSNSSQKYDYSNLRNKIMNDVDEHNRQYKRDMEKIRAMGGSQQRSYGSTNTQVNSRKTYSSSCAQTPQCKVCGGTVYCAIPE
jgi:hypothetical protein